MHTQQNTLGEKPRLARPWVSRLQCTQACAKPQDSTKGVKKGIALANIWPRLNHNHNHNFPSPLTRPSYHAQLDRGYASSFVQHLILGYKVAERWGKGNMRSYARAHCIIWL